MNDDSKASFDFNGLWNWAMKLRGTLAVVITVFLAGAVAYPRWKLPAKNKRAIQRNKQQIRAVADSQRVIQSELQQLNRNIRIAICTSHQNPPSRTTRSLLECQEFAGE